MALVIGKFNLVCCIIILNEWFVIGLFHDFYAFYALSACVIIIIMVPFCKG